MTADKIDETDLRCVNGGCEECTGKRLQSDEDDCDGQTKT